MIKKRGLSTVVATVLILVITIAAVAIIAGVIIPFVRKTLEQSSVCVPYQDYFKFKESFEYNQQTYSYNCVNLSNSGNLYAVSVQAAETNKSSEVGGFNLIFINDNSKTINVSNSKDSSSSVNGIRLLDSSEIKLKVPKEGEFYTYVFNAGSNIYNEIDVYPYLTSGKSCPVSDKIIKVNPCSNIPLDSR